MTRVSGRLPRAISRTKRGTTSMPPASITMRNPTSRKVVWPSTAVDMPLPLPMRGQQRQQEDGDEILGDKHRKDDLGEAATDVLVGEGLGDDGGAGDGAQRAGENALGRAPAEQAAGEVAQPRHQAALDEGDQPAARGGTNQTAQAELEAEREHQQDDADVRQRVGQLGIDGERSRHVGADQQPGQQVAEHDGQAQALEDRGAHGRDPHNEREIREMAVGRAGNRHGEREQGEGAHGRGRWPASRPWSPIGPMPCVSAGEVLLLSGCMSSSTCGRTLVFVACLGQVCVGCAENTPDHLDFALRTARFEVSSGNAQWRQVPAGTLVPNVVCAGPQALITDCCSPPPPAVPIDCQQVPLACDPADNFCALTFDMEQELDVNLIADVAAVAAVDGRVFSNVSLLWLGVTVTGLDQLPLRNANLYIGSAGMGSSSNPAAKLLAPVDLVPGQSMLALDAAAQQAFSSFARDYRMPFALLLSVHVVVRNGTTPTGKVTIAVDGRAEALY